MHILHETLQEKGALVPNRLRSRHAGKERATRGSIGASVEGSLDALSATDLGKESSTQIESGHSNLVANLADVDYSISAGLLKRLFRSDFQAHSPEVRRSGKFELVLQAFDKSQYVSFFS